MSIDLNKLDFWPYRLLIRFLCWVPVPWSLERKNVFYNIFAWQYGASHLLQYWREEHNHTAHTPKTERAE